jgi:hypothetical protein
LSATINGYTGVVTPDVMYTIHVSQSAYVSVSIEPLPGESEDLRGVRGRHIINTEQRFILPVDRSGEWRVINDLKLIQTYSNTITIFLDSLKMV